MSRAGALFVVAALSASCGDGGDAASPAPAPAPQPGPADPGPPAAPPLPEGPLEATLDDERVLAFVVAASARDGTLPESCSVLPPRVSPVRVAVRALHDHLLGVRDAAASWDGLLRALGALSGCRATADAGALAPLVETWRTWTKQDRDAEGELAQRTTRALDLLRAVGPVDVDGLARLLTAPPKGPAKSPAEANLAALRAAHVALSEKAGGTHADVGGAVASAQARFAGLGWPGGAAVVLDLAAGRLLRGTGSAKDPSRRTNGIILANVAMDAYAASNDAVRSAAVLLDLAADARSQPGIPDLVRAEGLAKRAEEALAAAGVRGREVVDASFARGWTLQALGRHEESLAEMDRVLREIETARLDQAQRVPVMERRATSLYLLERYDEALAAADAGVAVYDALVKDADPAREQVRADLDAIAAESLVELDRAAEGADRHLRAAERYERLSRGGVLAAQSRLLAARARLRAGDKPGAVALVRTASGELSYLSAAQQAQAAGVLRDAGDLEEARRALDFARAKRPDLGHALSGEDAMLEAAAGNTEKARELFSLAVTFLGLGGADVAPSGLRGARIFLDWARMEDAAGDPERARSLTDRALHHLSAASLSMETDRAQILYVALSRRLLAFADAERVTAARLERGVRGAPSRRLDAQLDLFLIRLERASAGGEDAARRLSEALAALPEGATREIAAAVAHPGSAPLPAEDPSLPPRVRMLREAASLHDSDPADLVAFARRTPVSEPEIRRWALARAVTPREGVGARRVDPFEWSDLFRGAEPVDEAGLRRVLEKDEAFVLIEPVGAWSRLVWTTATKAGERAAMGDLGLPRLWDAVHVERTREAVESAAAAVMSAGLRDVLAEARKAGAARLTISLAPPLGPLPFELLPWGEDPKERTLFDVFDVAVVASARERVESAARKERGTPEILRNPRMRLTDRNAFVCAGTEGAAGEVEFLDAYRAAVGGQPPAKGVRAAKESLRAAPEPKSGQPSGVPLWATFLLRGAW